MADEQENIKIQFDTNAKEAAQDTNQLAGSLDKVTESQKGVAKAGKSTVDGLEEMGGAIGETIGGMKAMLKQMWAIVANPLGLILVAIVGALTLLFKAFTSTNDGADKFEQIMSGISAVVDILRDRFLKLAGALGKLFTGDFVGAAKEAKAAVSGLGDEIEKEFKQAATAKRYLQEVEDAMRDLGVTRAKLNRDLAASKEIITDETASYAEKKKAIEAVRVAEGKQTEQELFNAKKKLQAIKLANSLSDTSDEDLQKEADAQAAVYKLQEEQSNNVRNLNKLDKRANAEESARLKAITEEKKAAYKAAADARKKANDKILADQKEHDAKIAALLKERTDAEQNLIRFNQDLNDKTEEQKLQRQKDRALEEIEILKQKGIDVAGILVLNEEKYFTLEQELKEKRAEEEREKQKEIDAKKLEDAKKLADEQIEIEKQVAEAKAVIQEKQFEAAERGISLISSLFGKSKAVQKAALIADSLVGIAKTVITTRAANAAARLKYALLPGGVALATAESTLNNVSAGIGIAANVAATAKGLSALGGGSAPTGSVGNSGSSGGSAPPSVAFNNSSENQIGQSISKTTAEQPPIKVVVAESDISKAQNNVKVLVSKNSF